jgi:hypothetical protein
MNALLEELDRSMRGAPPLPPVEHYVKAGRRALRRRRMWSGATGVAAAAVVVTGWYAVSTGSPTDSGTVAGDPTATPSASVSSEDPPEDATAAAWPRGELIRYVAGQLQVRPGVVVHERIRNPYGYAPPALSDALDVTWRGHRQWLMIEKQPPPQGISSSASTPSNGWASFADYVADQVAVDGGSGWPDTFVLDDGRVVPARGTHVFDRTDDPQLGATFAPQGAPTGAAVVSVDGEAGSYFVVWRVIDGMLDVITTSPDETVGATFDELLAAARARYASGEGLR